MERVKLLGVTFVVLGVLSFCSSVGAADCDAVVQAHWTTVETKACPIPGCPSGDTTVTTEHYRYSNVSGGYNCSGECVNQAFQWLEIITCANCPGTQNSRKVLGQIIVPVCPGDTSWQGFEGAVGY
jgi:hypothetical protein